MFTNPQRASSVEARQLRLAVGQWLRGMRLRQGLVQRDVAEALALRYYTQWAQIENGIGRVSAERYHLLAAALGLEPGPLARRLMRAYDPLTHAILFAGEAPDDPQPSGPPLAAPVSVPAYTAEAARALRHEGGHWLKERREAAGLAQTVLAERLGYRFYTRVSQIERGIGRVPPEEFEAYAEALGMDTRDLVEALFSFYDPMVYHLAFIDRR